MENSSAPDSQQEKRQQLSMRVIQAIDPELDAILFQVPYAALYKADYVNKRWQRAGYEGALYCVKRKRHPTYRLYLLNKLSQKNFIQDITEDNDFSLHGNFIFIDYPQDSSSISDRLTSHNKGSHNNSYTKEINSFSLWSHHHSEELFHFLCKCVEDLKARSLEENDHNFDTSHDSIHENNDKKSSPNEISSQIDAKEPYNSAQNGSSNSNSYLANTNKEAGLKLMKLLKKDVGSDSPKSFSYDTVKATTPNSQQKPSKSNTPHSNERKLEPFFTDGDKTTIITPKKTKDEKEYRNEKPPPSIEINSENRLTSPTQRSTYQNSCVPNLQPNIVEHNKTNSIDNILTEPMTLLMDFDNISLPKRSFVNSILPRPRNEGENNFTMEDLDLAVNNILKRTETKDFFLRMLYDELSYLRKDSFKGI